MLPIPYPAETLTALNRFVSNGKKDRSSLANAFFIRYILSQNNATVFYFDNISFLAHALNQLFLPNDC